MASDATPATIPSALNLSDLNTTVNHEPRISHIRLAQALGYDQSANLRRLIERNAEELARYAEVSSTMDETSARGGRPGKTYWLNEPQALLVCIRSDAPQAPTVRQSLIQVYMDWRHGQMAPPTPPTPSVTDSDGRSMALTEQEIMVALAFRRQVERSIEAAVEAQVRDRVRRNAVATGIAIADIVCGDMVFDAATKRLVYADRRGGG